MGCFVPTEKGKKGRTKQPVSVLEQILSRKAFPDFRLATMLLLPQQQCRPLGAAARSPQLRRTAPPPGMQIRAATVCLRSLATGNLRRARRDKQSHSTREPAPTSPKEVKRRCGLEHAVIMAVRSERRGIGYRKIRVKRESVEPSV